METFLKIAAAGMIPTAAGMAVLFLLFRRFPVNLLFSTAIAFGLGLGLLGQGMLLLGILGIEFNLLTISGALLAMTFVVFFIHNLVKDAAAPALQQDVRPQPSTLKEKIIIGSLALFIGYHIYYVFWRALNVPVSEWDAVSFIAFNAKVFFYERALYQPSHLPHAAYPLQVPLMMTWIAVMVGKWHELLVNAFFPLMFCSYLVIHYSFLRLHTSRPWALAGVALLCSSNFFIFHSTIAYRDFTMLYFHCATILLLLIWHKSRDDSFLLLAGLWAGFTTFIKLEGTMYLVMHTILFLIICGRLKKFHLKHVTAFLLPAYGTFLFYQIYKFIGGLSTATQIERFHCDFTWGQLERIPLFAQRVAENLFFSGNWNIVWVLLFLSLLRGTRSRPSPETVLSLISLAVFFAFYFFLALLTPNFISLAGAESPTVLSRIILHIFPLATIPTILLIAPRGHDA